MRAFRYAAVSLAVIGSLVFSGCGGSTSSSQLFSTTTLAGSGTPGTSDGSGAAAQFNNPVNVTLDSHGTLFVADFDNNRVRKITPLGVVTTIVNQANFSRPFGITCTPDDKLYVQTDANDTGGRDGTTGTIWNVNPNGGTATVVASNLGRPRGLTALPDGRLVLVDLLNNTVRLMNPATAAITDLAGKAGTSGFADGTGEAARFDRPYGPAILPTGEILLADQNNNRLRKVTLAGVVTTYAGTGISGAADGLRLQSTFNHPQDVAVDSNGTVYVSDVDNHLIRRITRTGIVTTIAGGLPAGFANGTGDKARFFGQEGLTVTPDGSTIYVADGTGGTDGLPYQRVRQIAAP